MRFRHLRQGLVGLAVAFGLNACGSTNAVTCSDSLFPTAEWKQSQERYSANGRLTEKETAFRRDAVGQAVRCKTFIELDRAAVKARLGAPQTPLDDPDEWLYTVGEATGPIAMGFDVQILRFRNGRVYDVDRGNS